MSLSLCSIARSLSLSLSRINKIFKHNKMKQDFPSISYTYHHGKLTRSEKNEYAFLLKCLIPTAFYISFVLRNKPTPIEFDLNSQALNQCKSLLCYGRSIYVTVPLCNTLVLFGFFFPLSQRYVLNVKNKFGK